MPLPSQSVSTPVLISTGVEAVFPPNKQMSFQVTNYLCRNNRKFCMLNCFSVLKIARNKFCKTVCFPPFASHSVLEKAWNIHLISKSLIWICFCGYELCYHSGSWSMSSGLTSWQFLSHLLWEAPLKVLIRHPLPVWPLVMVFSACRGDVLLIPSPGGVAPMMRFLWTRYVAKMHPGWQMGLVIRGQEVIVHLVSWADLSALPSFFYFLPPYTFIEYFCETGDGRN